MPDSSWTWETRMLYRVALVIFTVTVAIGLFNGFHFIELSRAVLLTHVHAGTLGFITLSVFATAFWLYSGPGGTTDAHARNVAVAMAVAVPLYVLAFLSGNFVLRAIFGVPVLLLILGMAVFLFRNLGTGRSTPRLGVLLALIVLVIGSTIGVLIQIQDAANHTFLPDNAVAGHASAQVFGYLVLVALSLIDWRLRGTSTLTWPGGIQVVLYFLAGLLVAIGALLNILPLLGSFIPLSIIATVIFLVRVGPSALATNWTEAGSRRHYAIAVPWVLVNIIVTITAVVIIIKGGIKDAPFNLFIAADHAIFIGVMVNLVFGLIQDFTPDQRHIVPWTEDVVFWVMNLALIGFVTTLLINQQAGEKFFVPFQGTAILVGIVVYSMRLAASDRESAAPAAAAIG
ncbi:MAG TPA: hypothetical protein VNV65_10470 [Candidatus Solibacter sp.]|jgi:hypothetical protein|nr:hypothetical protein [Candidatus Solibacter sp.]